MATILIGADLCPIEENRQYFMEGDAASLFHDLLPDLHAADLVIANLECPLIEKPSPIFKTGPTFGEPGDCIRGIKAGGIGVLGLANNHILDHGAPGLQNTIEVCRKAGIETVGAGPNLAAAGLPLIRQVSGVRVAILAYAENEFSIAGKNSWGANPLNPIEFVRTVAAHQDQFDHLIVLVHGSAEFHAPTPRIQDTCRFMVEQGAHTVVVQHPHMLGGCENYQGGTIVYGQGALVMDEAVYRSKRSFHEGFLLRIDVSLGAPTRTEWIPFEQSDPTPGARRLRGDAESVFRKNLQARSLAITDPDFVEAEWRRFCKAREHGYVSSALGHGGILRRLNAKGLLERHVYGPGKMAGVRNILCCETHREALQTILDGRREQARDTHRPGRPTA